jgi:glutaredoxin
MNSRMNKPPRTPQRRTVTLIGKPGCHLCDDARAVIEKVVSELGASEEVSVSVEERDITQDEELYRKYWEQIPVVLVDGAQHDFWRVDENRLRERLHASGGRVSGG